MGPKKVAGSAEEAITSGSVHKEVIKVVEKKQRNESLRRRRVWRNGRFMYSQSGAGGER